MTPSLPQIEPVERLMIVVGLRALISREVERFRKSDLKEFDALPKEVAALAGKLVRGQLVPGSSSRFDYRATLKELAAGWDPKQVIGMVEAFPGELRVYASALVVKTKALIDTLQAKYPQTNYVTATGSISLVPADRKIFKFVQVLEVLCAPLSVFSLMSQGALLQTQVQAVRMVYPSLATAIDAAILEATVKAKADKKSFELPRLAEIGVRAWFGKGPIPTDSLRKAQAAVDRSNARRQPASAPPATTGIDQARLTQAQRVSGAT